MSTSRIVVSINSTWNFVNFRRGLIRGLLDGGFEVVAVAPADRYAEVLRTMGVRVVPLAMNSRAKSPIADAALLFRYWRILRRERPVAYLGYTIKPNIYGAIAAHMLGIPVVSNVAGLGTVFLRKNWLNRLVRFLYRIALRRARVVFFQNREDRELFVSLGIVTEERAVLLPGSGIDVNHFTPSVREGRSGFAFLLTARLLWSKGVGEYVKAAERIRTSMPDVAFRIAGIFDEDHPDGVSRAYVEAQAAAGTIEYLGNFDDVRSCIADADCVVLPSFYPEGTPRSLLEAAAMAKPLIAADMPGCRDVVENGRNGYLCRPKEAASLAETMERMLSLSPESLTAMGDESRRKAVSQFNEEFVISKYMEALRPFTVGASAACSSNRGMPRRWRDLWLK
jgi:glycosyltransferase involved in cell wall biosynthesis